jgi:hypothetical protein
MSEMVEDKPWRVREFSLRDLDNNPPRLSSLVVKRNGGPLCSARCP